MDKKALKKKMKEFMKIKEKKVEEKNINVSNMTFIDLKDCLFEVGTILDEDSELNSYVIAVPAGITDLNTAILAIQLEKNVLYLIGYAREGLIYQHTVKTAMERVEKQVEKYIRQE